MTKEQREKTKLALRRYGTRQWAACPANAGWRLAIERPIEYYQQEDPLRADLLRLRYLERRNRALSHALTAVLALAAVALFIAFYPYASGLEVSREWLARMNWFKNWMWY